MISDKKLVTVSCYNCNSEEFDFYDEENGFRLVKCSSCGLLYVNPRPVEESISSAAQYGIHEGESQIDTSGRYSWRRYRRFRHVLKDFYKPDELGHLEGNWLDIGCGFGEFIEALNHFKGSKITIIGTELNRKKIEIAKKRGLDVDEYKLEEIKQKFQYISLLNVFSHLVNPVEFINDLKDMLLQGGELLIQTGHTSHLTPEQQQRIYNLPDHLSFANQEIVVNILERLGFEILETRIYRGINYPRFYNIIGIMIELIRILIQKKGKLSYLFPESPYQDMFIRCKLRSDDSMK